MSWSGEDPLNNAMGKVASRNPPSASAIKNFVKICSSYSKEYKHIVHYVERFVKDCDEEEFLPMCYAIDAILRNFTNTSKELGRKLCSRFQTNLVTTMEHFSKANKKDKKTIKKVVGRWKDKNFFDPMTMEDAMDAAGIGESDDNGDSGRSKQQKEAKLSSIVDLLSSNNSNNNNNNSSNNNNSGPNNYNNNFQPAPHQQFPHQGRHPQQMYGRGMLPNMGMPPRGMPPRGMPSHQMQQQFRGPPQHFQPPPGNNGFPPRGMMPPHQMMQQQFRGPPQHMQNQGMKQPPTGKKPEQDEICHGFINNIKDYGCFVQLDGAHAGHFGLVQKAHISNDFVRDVHAAVQRNQPVFVKVLEIKQNPQNGRTDYSFSMRAVNQQTGVEQSTENQQQPQPQMQQQQPNQGMPAGKKPEQDEICHGFINNIKDFGCFVQLDGAHAGHFGLVQKAQISNDFVSDVHAAVERNQKVYVKVLQLKQNPQNGRTDYSLSMRAVNQQTGVEQSTDQQPQQRTQYQQRQQPPPQQQQQQQQQQQLRVNGTTRILPSGYSGSKANMIPLGKKRNFGAMSTDSSNGSTGNNISTTNSTYQYQQPAQPSVGMNNNSNNAPQPPQGLFKSAPAPFKAAPAPFKAAPAPFKAAPAPFKAAPAPPAGLFKSAPAPPAGLFKTSSAPPPSGLFKTTAAPPPFKKAKQ